MLAHFAHHLLTALPVPMQPFIRDEFGLNYTRTALIPSAFSLAGGFGQLPAGWAADCIGPRILIAVGICGVALAGTLVGISHAFILMIVFLVLMGLASGGYHPAAAPLISASVEPRMMGRTLGLHMVGGSASFFIAPLVAASIAATWGWRWSFIGLAVPALIFGIIFYIFLGRYSPAPQHKTTSESDTGVPRAKGQIRSLVIFMVLSIFVAGTIRAMVAIVPLYMVDYFGTSEQTGASMVAIIYAAGLFAGPIGGYLSDRLGRIRVILVMSTVAGLTMYAMNLVSFGPGVWLLLILIGMAMFIRIPVSEAYLMSVVPKNRRSTIYGVFYFSSQESGAVLAPVMGYLVDHYGFSASFTTIGVTTIAVTLICGVLLWGSRNN